jgi:type I restriction enzyme S subunit
MEAFVDLPFPVPAVEEQRRIADFLDVETAKLDELLKLMKEQEELLDGKRNAVLARSWGEGKASLRRVGYFLKVVTSGPRGWGDYVSDQGIMFFRSANLRRNSIDPNLTALTFVDLPSNVAAESRRSRVQNGDVLMGITGANTGWVAHATSEMVGASVSQHVCLIRPGEKMHGRWLAYFLASPQVQEILLGSQYGGTKQQLSLPDLRDLDSPQLSFSDQIRISAKLDEAIAVLETEQRLRRRQVELLQERRRALITAAVTGELDVTTARGI